MFPLKLNILSNYAMHPSRINFNFRPFTFPFSPIWNFHFKKFRKNCYTLVTFFFPPDRHFFSQRILLPDLFLLRARDIILYYIISKRGGERKKGKRRGKKEQRNKKSTSYPAVYATSHARCIQTAYEQRVGTSTQEYTRVGGEGGTFCPQTRQGPHRAH